jgi:hypothetical protein
MRMALVRVAILMLLLTAGAATQYGHPLKGSWSGDWGPNKEARTRLLLELNWDGKTITGTINPGTNAIPLQRASLDPSNWTVRFEAEGKDPAGRTIRYVIEGKIDNLGSAHRVMTGVWNQGSVKGDFRLIRN